MHGEPKEILHHIQDAHLARVLQGLAPWHERITSAKLTANL